MKVSSFIIDAPKFLYFCHILFTASVDSDVDSGPYVISLLLIQQALCIRMAVAAPLGIVASTPICSIQVFCPAAGLFGWKEAGVSVPQDFEQTPSYQRVWFAFTGYHLNRASHVF